VIGALVLVLVFLLLGQPAAAASLVLTEAEQAEAVRYGEQSVIRESFGEEWRVPGGGGDSLSVMTPFHRLALAARHATFRNNKKLTPSEITRTLRGTDQRLEVWVALTGQRDDFARLYTPTLLVDDREVKAAFVQNEFTAARQENGRYLARCVYGFPTRDISGTSRVALVVADSDGRSVGRFTIDLGKMR
jgi:hypothetical protein